MKGKEVMEGRDAGQGAERGAARRGIGCYIARREEVRRIDDGINVLERRGWEKKRQEGDVKSCEGG